MALKALSDRLRRGGNIEAIVLIIAGFVLAILKPRCPQDRAEIRAFETLLARPTSRRRVVLSLLRCLHCNDCRAIFVARLPSWNDFDDPLGSCRRSSLSLPKIPSGLARAGDIVGSGRSNAKPRNDRRFPLRDGPGQSDRLDRPRRADPAGVGCRSRSKATVRPRLRR